MRTHVVVAALVSLNLTNQVIADPIGDAFCAQLLGKTVPTSGEIYYKDRTGKIQLFPHIGPFTGSTEPDLFYFRNRNDVPKNKPGVVTIKISYLLNAPDQTTVVGLLNNNLQSAPDKCPQIGIDRYERFHGQSREPNSCLQYGFHQTAPFNTVGNAQRVNSFLFGASDIDVRPVTADIAELIPALFSNFTSWLSSKGTSGPRRPAVRYRSWIFNYSGQPQSGLCVRFQPVITREYGGAKLVANDLLETPFGEHPVNSWSVAFGSSR
jgi:hypothetical protein